MSASGQGAIRKPDSLIHTTNKKRRKIISTHPIILDIQYTPFRLKRGSSEKDIAAHAERRSFYNMTGGKNVLSYITTEAKRVCKASALEYLQKSTGVFNQNGMIEKEQIEAMKARVKANTGNIWHGFISLSQEESHKIDTPEKCIALVKRTFGMFFKEARFNEDNIDLMCALHTDRPHHLHIHYVFWEKEPKVRDYNGGGLCYRKKGKIEKDALERLSKRLENCIDDNSPNLYKARDKALEELKKLTNFTINSMRPTNEEIKDEIITLAKDLPKTGRLSYGSKDMEPYRERVDKIVIKLLNHDPQARRANNQFYDELWNREKIARNSCANPFPFPNSITQEPLPHKIDEKSLKFIEEIESDYKRRQGNLVLNLAKTIKPEIFERKQGKRYKRNDNNLKRSLCISRKKVGVLLTKFLSSIGDEMESLSKEHTNRLREIEAEMQFEKRQEEKKEESAIQNNSTKYSFSK